MDETTAGRTVQPVRVPGGPVGGRRHLLLVRARSLTVAERVVYGGSFVYATVFTFMAVARHLAFRSQQLDLGDMTQAIWSTLHGHFLEGTTQSGEQITRLAVHVDPFLVLLVPFWWIWPSPLLLVGLQGLAVSAGALPVFWLARKHLDSQRAAAFLALAYLAYPATQFNVYAPSTGFHPVSLAIPLLLLAIWFLDEGRLAAFAVVGILAATTKEEMPLVVGLLGLWYAKRSGRWRLGLSVLGAGLALTLVDFLVVIPHYLGDNTFFRSRYAAVGGSPGGILRTAVTDPGAIVAQVATVHKLVYVLLLLVPFLGLWSFEPLLVLAVLPDLAINLLSSEPNMTSVSFQYTAGMAPFIVAASILGLARLRRLRPRVERHVSRLCLYVLALVMLTAVESPFLFGVGWVAQAFPGNRVHQIKARALSLVPAGVPVSASNQLAAHLAERSRIFIFPTVREARWIVVDEHDRTYDDKRFYAARIRAVRHDPRWRLLSSAGGVLVFEKPSGRG